jgi:hypothetical protein
MMRGMQETGQKSNPPNPTKSPFNLIGILDANSLEDLEKAKGTKAFKEEFFSQWFSKWVADFYVLRGFELYHGEGD